MISMLRIFFFLLLSQVLQGQAPSMVAELQSNFIIEGEDTFVTITTTDMEVTGWPTTPQVSPLTVRQERYANVFLNGRISKVFSYRISSLKTGTFTIPSFRLGRVQSNPTTVHVMKRSLLKKEAFIVNGKTYPYYSAVFVANPRPYVGETQKVEAKLYIPAEIRVESPVFADFDKKDVVAWRFDAQQSSGGFREGTQNFRAVQYLSAITPLSAGDKSFGPGTASPVINYGVQDRGRIIWNRQTINCHFPPLSLDVQPLPQPQPPGFAGAVGDFRLLSNVGVTKVSVGDPITIELQISGTGNLDQLGAPRLLDDEKAFKQFDISKKPQGSERRSATGIVEFSQVIRPTQVTSEIPPYELAFFDPVLKQYRSALTPAVPLIVKPSATAAAASISSKADPAMAFLAPGTSVIPATAINRPWWLWQIIPALLALYFVIKKLRPAMQAKQQQSQVSKEFENDFKKTITSTSRSALYREAAQLIDRWSQRKSLPEGAEEIVNIRDEICFSPDAQDEPALPKEKTTVGNVLRQLAPVILLSLIFLPESLKADRQSRLDEALANPTPEAFYNLGLEEKKAGNSAAAALYFYRHEAYAEKSEALDPLLRSIEAIRRVEPRGMEMISLIPRSIFHHCGVALLWGLGLTVFVLIARIRGWAPFLIHLTIVTGALWLLAKFYYPRDVSFEPLKELSAVMTEQELRDAPFDGAEVKRKIPVGSLGKISGSSGPWTYIEFPGGATGWISREAVTPIAGRELWSPPTSQKD
ncbi:MAG: BatD family protein [Akkermansiaceae bacterium]